MCGSVKIGKVFEELLEHGRPRAQLPGEPEADRAWPVMFVRRRAYVYKMSSPAFFKIAYRLCSGRPIMPL